LEEIDVEADQKIGSDSKVWVKFLGNQGSIFNATKGSLWNANEEYKKYMQEKTDLKSGIPVNDSKKSQEAS
jgi:hypothetical protein